LKITEIPFQIISIEDDGFHLLTQGTINKKAATFLIDTGASRSVFDENAIQKYLHESRFEDNEKLSTGLGTNTMPTKIVEIEEISFGEMIIENYLAVAIDLSHVTESYNKLGLPEIDGVLGSDILHDYKCVINYRKRKLKFYY
jgi:predicted aspartyl protease